MATPLHLYRALTTTSPSMAESATEARKSIKVAESTHRRLKQLKPYETMSFDELIDDMAGLYAEERGAP